MDDKILGSKKTSLIITEDDYIEFLADVGRQNLRIPTYIISKIQTSSLLFLGYSLEDWDFRTIYNVLSKYMPGSGWEKKLDQNGNKQNDEEKRKSIAIQWKPKSFWVKFWQKKGIDIYNMDIYDFASQLKDTYDEMYTRRGEQ